MTPAELADLLNGRHTTSEGWLSLTVEERDEIVAALRQLAALRARSTPTPIDMTREPWLSIAAGRAAADGGEP